jgi:hypothetical protein
MNEISGLIVEAITLIANHDRVIKELEKDVCRHIPVENWQTRRILYAILLFNEEIKK